MKRLCALSATAFALCMGAASAADIAGSHDHPLVGRFEGSSISLYQQDAFNELRFISKPLVSDVDESNSIVQSGRTTRIRYEAPNGRSTLEIFINYQESLKSKGFQILFACGNHECMPNSASAYEYYQFADAIIGQATTEHNRYTSELRYILAKLTKPEGDVYASVTVGKGGEDPPIVRVAVVETRPVETGKIAFVDANAMAQSIRANGRVALYGIYFDTDKADIKPESKPTLDEMAKFLKSNPSINIIVTGHTDSQGTLEHNFDLSRRRAQAVASALSLKYGISSSRLTPYGVGMVAPIASNEDEAGRAKNRRVELVQR